MTRFSQPTTADESQRRSSRADRGCTPRSYDYIVLDIGRFFSRIRLPLIQQADLIILIVSTDQSTVHLTKTVWEFLKSQGVDDQKVYAILNRAVGLEGVTKSAAEATIGIPIKITLPYMDSNSTLANNLNQLITKNIPAIQLPVYSRTRPKAW